MVGGVPGPIVLAAGAFREMAYEYVATVSHALGFASVKVD